MKKNCIIILLLINLITLSFNVDLQTKEIEYLKLETLANCETPVSSGNGQRTMIDCSNPDGTEYRIPCCDFDPGYEELCRGRKCSD